MNFKRRSLKWRLMFSYIIISILLMSVGVVAFIYQKKIVNNYQHIVTTNLPNAVVLGDMNQDISKMVASLFELSLGQLKPEEIEDLKTKIQIAIENFEKGKEQYEASKSNVEGEAEVYQPVKENWPKLKELVLRNKELVTSSLDSDKELFRKNYIAELGPLTRDFSENLNFVLDFQKAASSENVENAAMATEQSLIILSSTIIVGVLFSILFGIFFSRSLVNELLQLSSGLKKVVNSILNESEKIQKTSTNLLISVEAEGAALQETSSSTEELSAMVKRNEENAEGSKIISDQSMQSSEAGRLAMSSMMEAIQEIDQSNKEILSTVEESNANISEISNSIKLIGEKTKVINDIVFQTKLLSFNASVEAARAGEQGKGFAVVAEEVGNLAQMSGNASKEISELLESSITKVENIISQSKEQVHNKVELSKRKLQRGIEVAENCQNVLEEVVTNAARVNDLLAEIAHASKEQTSGIEEISRALAQLDANTASNTQTAKNSEISSKGLANEAHELNLIVTKLEATVIGEN